MRTARVLNTMGLVALLAPLLLGAQQPAPIGGLRTTPITRGAAVTPGTGRPVPYGWIGARVIDAPVKPYGVHVIPEEAPAMRPRFTPTYEPPQWTIDSTAERSTLWRSLIVRDVICDYNGTCIPRTSRVRARWVARCDCYAFVDGLGRGWMVGRR